MTRWLMPLCAGLAACTDLPWGAGGAEVGLVTRHALTRTLGAAELALGENRLANELGNRVGHSLSLRNLTLPLNPGYEVGLGAIEAALGPVTIALDDDPHATGLALRLELSVGQQTLTGLPQPCDALIALPPGALVVQIDLSSDKLGRLMPIPRGNPKWDGQPPELTVTGCALADLQVPDLTTRLAQAAWAALQDPLISTLPGALGLDLAFSTSKVTGLDALGAGIIRSSLRASENPVQRTDAGLAITFDLGLDADAHPCASLSPVPEAQTVTPPDLAGTSLALPALERAIRLAWVAGSICGASAWTAIPEAARELPLADLTGSAPHDAALPDPWPGLTELLALEPSATASATFWPHALPTLSADDELEDALRIEIDGLEADIHVVLDGARWRLFTLELGLVIRGQLASDSNGFVHFDVLDAVATTTAATRGLGPPPSIETAAQIVEPIVRALLESRPILRLPPSLTPNRTRIWRVGPLHTTLSKDAR